MSNTAEPVQKELLTTFHCTVGGVKLLIEPRKLDKLNGVFIRADFEERLLTTDEIEQISLVIPKIHGLLSDHCMSLMTTKKEGHRVSIRSYHGKGSDKKEILDESNNPYLGVWASVTKGEITREAYDRDIKPSLSRVNAELSGKNELNEEIQIGAIRVIHIQAGGREIKLKDGMKGEIPLSEIRHELKLQLLNTGYRVLSDIVDVGDKSILSGLVIMKEPGMPVNIDLNDTIKAAVENAKMPSDKAEKGAKVDEAHAKSKSGERGRGGTGKLHRGEEPCNHGGGRASKS